MTLKFVLLMTSSVPSTRDTSFSKEDLWNVIIKVATMFSVTKILQNMKLIYPLVVSLIVVVFLATASALGIAIPVRVTQTNISNSELSVVGEGKVEIIPDIASVDVGVTVNKVASAKDAQNKLSEINEKIVVALGTLGVNKVDIKTSNFSINPNYNYTDGGQVAEGYNGNATLSVKIRDTSKVGDVIESATTAGATDIYNTSFSVEDPAKYREQARTKAINNAREQAKKIADQLGIKLGRVTNIVESSGSTYPIYSEKMATGMGGGAVPNLEPGSQTVSSTVTLFFEKK